MLLPLRARESNNYRKSRKDNNFREKAIKKRTDTINEAKKIQSDNFPNGNREKSIIAITILEK